jgi:hypothetical protein
MPLQSREQRHFFLGPLLAFGKLLDPQQDHDIDIDIGTETEFAM